MSRLRPLVPLLVLAALAPGTAAFPRAAADPAPPAPSYFLEVASREGESLERLTIFKDGMAVYTTRKPDAPDLFLKRQLSPEEVKVYLDAIAASRIYGVTEAVRPAVTGQLVRTWTLSLSLPKLGERRFEGASIQSLPLPVATVLTLTQTLTEALLQKWRDTDPFQERPPAAGDVLESFEGNLYAVARFVPEREQYELRGVNQPVTYFVRTGELKLFFKGYADLPRKP